MPETSKKKGNVLTRKVGPLPAWGWAAVGVGAFVAFKYYEARKAARNAAAGSATSGGTTIPGPGGTSPGGPPQFSSLAQWEQAAIAAMAGAQLSPAEALNGLTDWINGQCVNKAQYNGISSILETVGLPPGFSTVPTLTICGSPSAPNPPPPTTPPPSQGGHTGAPSAPALPAAIVQAMTGNGEHIVDVVYDAPTKTFLYLTNKGGVYALNPQGGTGGASYWGSYLGLPSSATQVAPGQPQRTFVQIRPNGDGSYTLIASDGATYTFGPGAGEARTQ